MATLGRRHLIAIWEAELDRLGAELLASELIAQGLDVPAPPPWVAPPLPGPIPEELCGYAERLAARQAGAREALLALLEGARQRSAYEDDPVSSGPVYIDVEA